jgi:CDP-glycerol glycerophosphotransferase (TagB/SpsB family)|tara:strand:- start:37912 stop:39111 length:1200 start_codon:yes stop_codon:yes gene_type:complete
MRSLYTLILNVFQLGIFFLSFLIPRKRGVWVFGAWEGKKFADNPRSLYEHVAANEVDLTPIWIAKSKHLCAELKRQGVRVYYYLSLKGLWYQLRADVVFFSHSHSVDLLGGAVWRSKCRYQLWHGTPLKKILKDDAAHVSKESRVYRRAASFVFPWLKNQWDFVSSPSDFYSKIIASAFGSTPVVSGYPRNDAILPVAYKGGVCKVTNIMYMPTFRGDAGASNESNGLMQEVLTLAGFDVARLDDACEAMGVELHIRLHPVNKLNASLSREIQLSRHLHIQDGSVDFYRAINDVDLLISDYSSVIFDFLLTGRPVIMAAFDLASYIEKSRALYFSYEGMTLTRDVLCWDDVMSHVSSFISAGFSSEYAERYKALRDLTNKYGPGGASARIVTELRSIGF